MGSQRNCDNLEFALLSEPLWKLKLAHYPMLLFLLLRVRDLEVPIKPPVVLPNNPQSDR